ncbi:NAD-dependent epimerase/dehydratase family protein [Acidisoma sp. 7E03]
MRVLVTGAAGFLGRGLIDRLAQEMPSLSRLVATDRAFTGSLPGGVEALVGDLADPRFVAGLIEPGFDLIFHLASLPGSLAEREAEAGFTANVMAPLALARLVAERRTRARFIFASSIAVYGNLTDDMVRPQTPCRPALSYGAHKWMMEIFLADLARRGNLAAVSLRLPGIVARPPAETGHGSAFMSQIFHKIAAGASFACPVPASARCWWMSREAAITALIHAATVAETTSAVIQLPVLHARIDEIAVAIGRVTGRTPDVAWGDDANITRLFGSLPALDASPALRLGFAADADAEALTRAALSEKYHESHRSVWSHRE